jgi:ribosomal protein S18 acetylase RimI-like enzyme
MGLTWVHEQAPVWDADKARAVGGAPPGVFEFADLQPGDPLAGEWWRVEDDGQAVAYGWMDVVWGDAEMLLAVESSLQGQEVGTFVVDHVEEEAAKRGLRYIRNVVRPTHPDGERLTTWLRARGFEPAADGALRRKVRAARPAGQPKAPKV